MQSEVSWTNLLCIPKKNSLVASDSKKLKLEKGMNEKRGGLKKIVQSLQK